MGAFKFRATDGVPTWPLNITLLCIITLVLSDNNFLTLLLRHRDRVQPVEGTVVNEGLLLATFS